LLDAACIRLEQASCREALESAQGSACGNADRDEPRAPRDRAERRENDQLLELGRDPERIGPGGLERAGVGEELARLAREVEHHADLHREPMLASALASRP